MGISGSADAGGTCATCLRKFVVNFRHNEKKYDGSYGFDWLRYDYIFRLNRVDGVAYKKLYRGNISDLYATYKEGQKNPIVPFGTTYIPAWLAIFAKTTNAQSSMGSSEINKNGVDLDLEILQLKMDDSTPLTNDGTILDFVPSNNFIKIKPNKIPLSNLISSRLLRVKDKVSLEKEYYYNNEKKINIKCEGGVLGVHEEICVYATKNGKKEKVGKLMLYKNNNIPKLELSFIDVVVDNMPIIKPKNYEYYLKFQSYNQALIRTEKRLETKFDLVTLSKNNVEISSFLNEVKINKALTAEYVAEKIVDLFDKYGGKYRPNDGKKYLNINADGHTRTYIFYTNLNAEKVNGYAPSSNMVGSKMEWGNAVVVFQVAQMRHDTLVHEIGHSLKLPHIFENIDNKFKFYQGFTGNIMDYTWYWKGQSQPRNTHTRIYFSKFQWDLLRTDRSLK